MARREESEAWVERVVEVVCGQCSVSGGSVNEGWQDGDAKYLRKYIGDFQELDSVDSVL